MSITIREQFCNIGKHDTIEDIVELHFPRFFLRVLRKVQKFSAREKVEYKG